MEKMSFLKENGFAHGNGYGYDFLRRDPVYGDIYYSCRNDYFSWYSRSRDNLYCYFFFGEGESIESLYERAMDGICGWLKRRRMAPRAGELTRLRDLGFKNTDGFFRNDDAAYPPFSFDAGWGIVNTCLRFTSLEELFHYRPPETPPHGRGRLSAPPHREVSCLWERF